MLLSEASKVQDYGHTYVYTCTRVHAHLHQYICINTHVCSYTGPHVNTKVMLSFVLKKEREREILYLHKTTQVSINK